MTAKEGVSDATRRVQRSVDDAHSGAATVYLCGHYVASSTRHHRDSGRASLKTVCSFPTCTLIV